MNRLTTSFFLFFALTLTTAQAQGNMDFKQYIIQLIRTDWVLQNTRLRYANSHEQGKTVQVERMRDQYATFIKDICKHHKDSMCILVEDTTYLMVIKPYEADHTLYNKLYSRQLCFIPYSKVRRYAIQGYINKEFIPEDYFQKFYEVYGMSYDGNRKHK